MNGYSSGYVSLTGFCIPDKNHILQVSILGFVSFCKFCFEFMFNKLWHSPDLLNGMHYFNFVYLG